MGATPKRESSRRYFICRQGVFVRNVDKDTPGAILRISSKEGYVGKEYYELFYETIDGELINVEYEKGKFGGQYKFTLNDGEEQLIIQMNSGYSDTRAMLESLQELTLGRRVRFKPWHSASSGKSGMITEELHGNSWERTHNFYKTFEKKGEKWLMTGVKNGYPDGSAVNWQNEFEVKEYGTKVDLLLYKDTASWVVNKLRPFLLEQEDINARMPQKTREDVIKPSDNYDHIPEGSNVEIIPNDVNDPLPF